MPTEHTRGFDEALKSVMPEAHAFPLNDTVTLAVRGHYVSFTTTLSPNHARMLAIHLVNAAQQAERAAHEIAETATRDAGVCADVSI